MHVYTCLCVCIHIHRLFVFITMSVFVLFVFFKYVLVFFLQHPQVCFHYRPTATAGSSHSSSYPLDGAVAHR